MPVLYKLFSRLLCNRLSPILEEGQCPDQAGFRSGFSTEDHLYSLSHLHEKAEELQIPLWCAAIDFQKAFDTVERQAFWNALAKQNVPVGYILLLSKLYTGQTGRIKTDVLSRPFDISRGTKQGDPLSSLIFNALLEDIFRDAKQKWAVRKYGVELGGTGRCPG